MIIAPGRYEFCRVSPSARGWMADNSFSGQEDMIFVESALVLEVGRLITVSVVRKI